MSRPEPTNKNNKCEGNKWMRLGSAVAKVLNPKDFPVGAEVKMTRVSYIVQADGSIRRSKPKKRTRHD